MSPPAFALNEAASSPPHTRGMLGLPLCFLAYANGVPKPTVAARLVREALGPHLKGGPDHLDNLFLTHSGAIFLMLAAASLPPGMVKDDAGQRIAWPGLKPQTVRWRGHAIVSTLTRPTSHAAAQAVARDVLGAAAGLASGSGAAGVSWAASQLFHPAEAFVAAVGRTPLPPEILVRLDWHGTPAPAGPGMGATTDGLSHFGLPELAHPPSGEEPAVIQDRLLNLAAYQLENGPVLNPDDTVGTDDRVQARIERPRMGDGKVLVVHARLDRA